MILIVDLEVSRIEEEETLVALNKCVAEEVEGIFNLVIAVISVAEVVEKEEGKEMFVEVKTAFRN